MPGVEGIVVAERLTRLRERAGLSPAEAARAARMSRQNWSRYESGWPLGSLAVAVRICRALGCRLDDLIPLAPPKRGARSAKR